MTRPLPPADVLELDPYGRFSPAPDLWDWIFENLISEGSKIHNPDHFHLSEAQVGILWTSAPCSSKGRMVIGMAEMPSFRCNKWQKARQEIQMVQWFGCIPDFVITLDAIYCSQASDAEFLALIEHELYHCGQALDEFGNPAFNKQTGLPKYAIKGHDVEEFVGVVRRYGVVSEEVKDLVIAAASEPEVSRLNITRACGTCALKSA